MHHDAVQIPWQPVKTRRASEEIYLQLREFILSGQLKPGDRLPSERAMMPQLNRSRPTIREALRQSRIVVLDSREKMIGFANAYAPEHLIISMRDAWDVAAQITAAGSVFIGPWSPESAGDYASGTNHTLPTGGWARAYSGVNTDSFLRKITYQELSRKGLAALSPTVIAMAEAEGLGAHAAAVRVRMKGGVL